MDVLAELRRLKESAYHVVILYAQYPITGGGRPRNNHSGNECQGDDE